MEKILGESNNLFDYLLVLLVYGMMFIIMRYANKDIELNFKKSFILLFFFWSIGMFIGNYVFYLLGVMSFLPWLNNFIHSFVWVGLCLGFLYTGAYKREWYEQFALFSIFSFVVKVFENLILGTWDLENFLCFHGKYYYIIAMSLVDGFYPVISKFILTIVSKYYKGIYIG
ncbi:MAG: hypothetical protein M3R36_09565 [Bacteroidota bacterium]|nr:hypothetical protein [Bacteroidota bacterium]